MTFLYLPSGAMPSGWTPPGYKRPEKTPNAVVSLSRSLDHLAKTGKTVEPTFRCPICGVTYESQEAMQHCASIEFDRTVKRNLGVDIGDPISFAVIDKRGRRATARGEVKEWLVMRTPRGHEEMPLVVWKGFPNKIYETLLVPAAPNNVMTAVPQFTRRFGSNKPF